FFLSPSTRRSPTAWAWASQSAARLSKPMVGGCGRPAASRGVLSFSLRSPLSEPLSVIDVAHCSILLKNLKFSADRESEGRWEPGTNLWHGFSAAVEGDAPSPSSADATARTTIVIVGPAAPRGRAPSLFLAHTGC